MNVMIRPFFDYNLALEECSEKYQNYLLKFVKDNTNLPDKKAKKHLFEIHENIQMISKELIEAARERNKYISISTDFRYFKPTRLTLKTKLCTFRAGKALLTAIFNKAFSPHISLIEMNNNENRTTDYSSDESDDSDDLDSSDLSNESDDENITSNTFCLSRNLFQDENNLTYKILISWNENDRLITNYQNYVYDPGYALEGFWQDALDRKNTDLTIEVQYEGETKLLYVHNLFIQRYSWFFKKQLDDLKESSKILKITDYPYEICKLYFEFLYTKKLNEKNCKDINKKIVSMIDFGHYVSDADFIKLCTDIFNNWLQKENLESNFQEVFYIGIKYHLIDVIEKCTFHAESNPTLRGLLISMINDDNYCTILDLADKYKLDRIRGSLLKKSGEIINNLKKRKDEGFPESPLKK